MLLQLLKQKKSFLTFLIAASIFFLLNFWIMQSLPGSRNEACVVGAGLTTFNIIFAILTSIAFGLLMMGMVQLYRQRKTKKMLQTTAPEKPKEGRKSSHFFAAGATVMGSFISFFTIFCVACTLPFITIFGAAISLNFFTDFEIEFKLLSLTLMFLALYLLNKQLEGCEICER